MQITKVCHLTSVHLPYDIRIFGKECKTLVKNGYEVYLVAGNCQDEDLEGVKIRNAGHITKTNRIKRISLSGKIIYRKAMEVNAEIYHIHDPELLPVGIKLKKLGKKIIFDSHEDVPMQIYDKKWIPKPFRKLVAKLYSSYERRKLSWYDGVIGVNPQLTSRLKKINPNTYQVTNFPILSKWEDNRKWEKKIVFAGSIQPKWFHHQIIQGLKDFPDVTYCLAGKGEESYISLLKDLNNWGSVDFYGYIPQKEVNALLQKCTIGIALHDYTGNVGFKKGTLGITKFFEYMNAGIPVVCTDFEVCQEIIERYECGLCVNPHDEQAVKDAVRFLLNNPQEAKRMGDNGRKAIENEFNWGIQEPILLELYRGLDKKAVLKS